MGMQAGFEQVAPEMLEDFIRQPRDAYEYFLAGMNEQAANAIPQLMELLASAKQDIPAEFKGQLERGMDQYRAMLETLRQPKGETRVDVSDRTTFSLEKDWHGLHYVLNGTQEGGHDILAEAILGGKEIPDEEQVMGYGPLRYLDSQRVALVAEALAGVDPSSLLAKLDWHDAEAKQIYLAHTLSDKEDWAYLPELFQQFRTFYSDAAKNGNAMLLSIT